MGQQHEMFSYILAGIGIIIVLWIAMRLRRGIVKDRERQARRERIKPGPMLVRNRYRVGGDAQGNSVDR
ncbi:MAG: hypothetical protein LBS67_02590 [Clostridiales Family XIII bacterium]|jgi:hypothetical protein|nr:hypothetical protein [Clostridiales Family XIII bacterium]